MLRIILHFFNFLFLTYGYSSQFGYMHPAAVGLYEIELNCTNGIHYLDYAELATQKDEQKFNINLILVFDERQLESALTTKIIQGGIGYNFTVLSLQCLQWDEVTTPKVTVQIYGLPY